MAVWAGQSKQKLASHRSMSCLEQIADAKIQAATQRIIDDLNGEVEAIKRRNAADGMLQSGRTLKQVARACKAAFDKLGQTAKDEYGLVIKESLWLKASVPDRLISDVKVHLQSLLHASETHLEKSAALIGNPKIYQRLQSDVIAVRDRTLNDLCLFIDGQSQVRRNRLFKGIGTNLLGWIPKLFGFTKKG